MNRFGDAPVDPAPSTSQVNRFGDSPAGGDGDSFGSALNTLQQQNSVPAGTESPYAAMAQGDIQNRQSGMSLLKTVNTDGTTTYTPVQNPSQAEHLTPQQKQDIIDQYQGQNPFAGTTPDRGLQAAQAAESARASIAATNSPLQNFANAGAQTLAQFGTGIEGAVAPQAAASQNQAIAQAYNYDPNSKAAIAGQLAGTALPLAPGFVAGAAGAAIKLGTDTAFAANAFGNVRTTVAQMRANGQDVSTAEELTAAALQAAVAFAATQARFKTAEQYVGAMKDGVAKAVAQYASATGQGIAIGAAQQLANNAIDKGLIDGSVPLGRGVPQAAAAGGALALIGGVAHAAGEHINPAPEPAAAPPAPAQPYDLSNGQPAPAPAPQPTGEGIPVEQGGKNIQTLPVAPPPVPNPVPLAEAPKVAAPAETVNPPTEREAAQLPPLLASKEFKTRVNEGDTSRGVAVEFESPIDKALFAVAQPRSGKVQAEAGQYLADAGLTDEAITKGKAAVTDAIQTRALSTDGDTLQLPRVYQPEPTIPLADVSQNDRAGQQVPVNSPNPQASRDAVRLNSPGFTSAEKLASAPVESARPDEIPLAMPEKRSALPSTPDVAKAVEYAKSVTEDFKVAKPANRDQAQAQQAFRNRGIQIVYYDGEGRGFHSTDHPGILFVNRSNVEGGLREAIGHEFMHELASSRPELFNDFANALPETEKKAFTDWYAKAFSKMRPGENLPNNLGEEAVTTPFGQLAGKGSAKASERGSAPNFLDDMAWKRVWSAALGEKPTVAQKVVDFFRDFTSKFSSKSRLIQSAIKAFESTLANPIERPERQQTSLRRAAMPDFLPTPNDRVRQEADDYVREAGIPRSNIRDYADVNVDRAKKIAAAYDAATHSPDDPKVKASYDAMKKETLDQWNFLKREGVKMEAWDKPGQPYADSKAMMKDVADNKHLYFFQGGDLPADHPLADKAPGTPYTYNDVFRAVHDYFGHAKEGLGFGPRGEENAWRSHSQMYSPEARPAMTAETRGQNSWVNFGPHGEHNQANPTETRYADQKATVLPDEFNRLEVTPSNRKVLGPGESRNPIRHFGRQPDFLPGSDAAKSFIDEDLRPKAEEALGGIKSAFAGVKNLLGLQSGKEAIAAKGVMRERGAELQQRDDRLANEFGKASKFIGKLSVDQQRDITDRAERGLKQADPVLQPVADAIRGVYDDRLKQLQKMGKLNEFVENYMGHLYEKPNQASEVLKGLGRSPLEGNKGFLKQRSIPFQSEAIDAGLTPVTDNPVEMMRLKVHQMDKLITANDAFRQLDAGGMLQRIKATDRVPDGYAKIDDRIATIYAPPSRKGAVQTQGYVVAPEPVASVINNFLKPGIASDEHFGPAFRAILGIGNVSNQVQLSLSAFHATGMMLNAGVSKLALAGEQAREGKLGAAAVSIGKAATVVGPVIENFRTGSKMLREWYKPGSTDPQTATLVDWLKAAGGRALTPEDYRTRATEGMKKAFADGNIFGAALRAPFAAIEKTAVPIMEKLVPRVKLGAFADLARLEMDKLGPGASRDDMRAAAGRAWNSIESRMGQVTYDNIFANRSVKNLAAAITRAPGWTGGTIAELGGGAKDLATGRLSHRSAYLLALPIFSAYVGGMLNTLMTGQLPQNFKDLYYPRTGSKDRNGKDERFSLPTYMNDAISYAKNPVLTLEHKASPLINLITELVKNEDFHGVEIRHPDDSYAKQAADVGKHVAGALVPFSADKAVDAVKAGQGAKAILPLVGLNPARRDVTQTDAENLAGELTADKRSVSGRTSAEAARSKLVGDIAYAIQQKEPDARARLTAAVKAGDLEKSDIERVKEHLKYSPLQASVLHMDASDVMKVWDVANPDERVKIAALVAKKLRGSENLPAEDKQKYLKQVRAEFQAAKGGQQ